LGMSSIGRGFQLGKLVHCRTRFAPRSIIDQVNRCVETSNKCGEGMRDRWRRAQPHACGGGGHSRDSGRDLLKPAPTIIRRNVPRSLLAACGRIPPFRDGTNRS
jgi:hypothetical protein